MSHKQSKKIRQLYRREFRKRAQEEANILMRSFKPKPRWCPAGVWIFFMRAFVKVGPARKKTA